MTALLDLADYRRRVHDLYSAARIGGPGEDTWRRWRSGRDELFATHPQSAFAEEDRVGFEGLPFFDYEPAWRIEAEVDLTPADELTLAHSGAGHTRFVKFGEVEVRGGCSRCTG